MLERLLEAARAAGPRAAHPFEERLERDEFEDRIDQLKKEIEAEIRRRLVADRGVEAMAKTLRKPLPEDVDFMHAVAEEMLSLRKAIYPLTRKLAVRLARKRRHGRKGSARLPATPCAIRCAMAACPPNRSSSTRGRPSPRSWSSPTSPVRSPRSPASRCTSSTPSRRSSRKVRSFVFIDGLDEVTSYFEGVEDIAEAVHRVNTEADVVWVDGHSDYGHAFSVFWEKYGRDIGPKTAVMILGDARNNYHASQSLDRQGDAAQGPQRVLAEPRTAFVLGHRRLDRGRVRARTATACSRCATCASSKRSSRTWSDGNDGPARQVTGAPYTSASTCSSTSAT